MDRRRAALGEGQQVAGQGVGRVAVRCSAGLVEHEDGEVGQEHRRRPHAGAGRPTAVPRRTDLGGQALGSPASRSPTQHTDEDGGQLIISSGAAADPQVLGQGGVEEVGALLDQAHDPGARRRRPGVPWGCRPGSPPRHQREEAHQHVGQRRLAGSARPDNCHTPPGTGPVDVRRCIFFCSLGSVAYCSPPSSLLRLTPCLYLTVPSITSC